MLQTDSKRRVEYEESAHHTRNGIVSSISMWMSVLMSVIVLRSELRLNKVEFMAYTALHRTARTVSTHGTVQYKARKHGPDSHHSSYDKIQRDETHEDTHTCTDMQADK